MSLDIFDYDTAIFSLCNQKTTVNVLSAKKIQAGFESL